MNCAYVDPMKRLILPLVLTLLLQPLQAQEATPNPDVDEGMSLLEQGAELLLRGMMSEMEPALRDMSEAFAQAEPMFRDLIAKMGDLSNYHAPQMLPNGDIIIRRKLPAELLPPPEVEL